MKKQLLLTTFIAVAIGGYLHANEGKPKEDKPEGKEVAKKRILRDTAKVVVAKSKDNNVTDSEDNNVTDSEDNNITDSEDNDATAREEKE